MVWSINDHQRKPKMVPGTVCVVFRDNVSMDEAVKFLDQFHPIRMTVMEMSGMACVEVGEGKEDAFIATVLQHPDKVLAAEREYEATIMDGSQ